MKYNFDLGAGDNGNVIGITNNRDTTRSQAFVYDSLNRIQTAGTVNTSGTNCWGETYGIDAWANLTSLALPSSYSSSCSHETPFSYTIPNSNQLPSASGFTYDAAGNLMASGVGNYVYNAEHQMTSVTVASTTTTYSYDGDGKRVEKSGGKIYWYGGGSDALDETDLSGNTNNSTFSEYVSFTGKKVARRDYQNNIYYYFADHLDTSREMVLTGQTTPCYDADFYPYGGENAHTTTCTQNYKFTAKERDSESNLDNFGGRYYVSNFGRFMAADWTTKPTAVPWAEFRNPQTLNLYSYVGNSPLAFNDPNGHCCWDWMVQHAESLGIGALKYVHNSAVSNSMSIPGLRVMGETSGLSDIAGRPNFVQPSNTTEAIGYNAAPIVIAGITIAVGAEAPAAIETEPTPITTTLTSPSFLGQESGPLIPVPEGATGPYPTDNPSNPGIQYNGGAGGNGLANNVTDVRVMNPNTSNPNGYVNYGSRQADGGWQSVNPYTGQSVPPNSFWWHIPLFF